MLRTLSTITLALAILLVAPIRAAAGPGTLAILYFDNEGNPELEPLKVGLAQMLITDLKGTPGVTVVERSRLQEILDELELGHAGVTDPDTAAKLGKLLGAEWMLLGSYFELLGTLRIDARLVKVETGEILHAHGVNDTARAFMVMEKAIAHSFRTHLEQQASAPPRRPHRLRRRGELRRWGRRRAGRRRRLEDPGRRWGERRSGGDRGRPFLRKYRDGRRPGRR